MQYKWAHPIRIINAGNNVSLICCLCQRGVPEAKLAYYENYLLQISDKISVHRDCLTFASDLKSKNDKLYKEKEVLAVVKSVSTVPCAICNKPGAATHRRRLTFHYPCYAEYKNKVSSKPERFKSVVSSIFREMQNMNAAEMRMIHFQNKILPLLQDNVVLSASAFPSRKRILDSSKEKNQPFKKSTKINVIQDTRGKIQKSNSNSLKEESVNQCDNDPKSIIKVQQKSKPASLMSTGPSPKAAAPAPPRKSSASGQVNPPATKYNSKSTQMLCNVSHTSQKNGNSSLKQSKKATTDKNRIYYSLGSLHPMLRRQTDEPSAIAPLFDDEAGSFDWYDEFWRRNLDEFQDVNEGEKEVMKLWNAHCLTWPIISDGLFPQIALKFAAKYGNEICEKRLIKNALLLLANFTDFGILTPEQCFTSIGHLQNCVKKYNNTLKSKKRKASNPKPCQINSSFEKQFLERS